MTDLATGLYAYGAIMAGLIQRYKTGKGLFIDCNLLSSQVPSKRTFEIVGVGICLGYTLSYGQNPMVKNPMVKNPICKKKKNKQTRKNAQTTTAKAVLFWYT